MLKGKFLQGAILTAAALWLFFAAFYLFNSFLSAENLLYDAVYQNASPIDTRIVLIGIDDDSIARIGQWPWPRSVMAEVVDILAD